LAALGAMTAVSAASQWVDSYSWESSARRGMAEAPRSYLDGEFPLSRGDLHSGGVANGAVSSATAGWDDWQRGDWQRFGGRVLLVDLEDGDDNFEGREWLEQRTLEGLAVGWDFEWRPDFVQGHSNPVALLQFASEDTALLLRTRLPLQHLPMTVVRALASAQLPKVCWNFNSTARAKLMQSFELQPSAVVELAALAEQKGWKNSNLRQLAADLGHRMQKDARVARSDWAAPSLTSEQIRYAAEDAFFPLLLWNELRLLPDAAAKSAPTSVAELTEELRGQSIEERDGFLWCTACKKGPMTSVQTAETHIQGQTHVKMLEKQMAKQVALPEFYIEQGIVSVCGNGDLQSDLYRCTLCQAGPFNSRSVLDIHIGTKKHQNRLAVPATSSSSRASPNPVEERWWNIPDYIKESDLGFLCSLCDAKATGLLPLCMHIAGEKHRRKCRAAGHEEISYDKDEGLLMVIATGAPFVRSGYTRGGAAASTSSPSGDGVAGSVRDRGQAAEPSGSSGHCADSQLPTQDASEELPPGWMKIWHEESRRHYYADNEEQQVQWDAPPRHQVRDWARLVDPRGRAFWQSQLLGLSFYEQDSGDWQRFTDTSGRTYWSNPKAKVRFFE